MFQNKRQQPAGPKRKASYLPSPRLALTPPLTDSLSPVFLLMDIQQSLLRALLSCRRLLTRDDLLYNTVVEPFVPGHLSLAASRCCGSSYCDSITNVANKEAVDRLPAPAVLPPHHAAPGRGGRPECSAA